MSTAMYVTVNDLQNALQGPNGDPTGTPAELSTNQLEQAIQQASSVVSTYTQASWTPDQWTPEQPVPQLVWALTIDLAFYYATLIYRRGKDLTADDPARIRYDGVKAIFADLVTGKIDVQQANPQEGTGNLSRPINTVPAVFTPANSGTRIRSGRVREDTPWPYAGGPYGGTEYA